MLKKIINIYNKVMNKNSKNVLQINNTFQYSDFENGQLFNEAIDKCLSANTDITGLEGTGKSNFITILTNRLYNEKKSYLMCSNSVYELRSHFQKHLVTDNILIFCLKSNKTSTIDINYLFSLESILDFICISDKEKTILKTNNYPTWFNFFEDEENSQLFKTDYFFQLRELIKSGHIDDYGDLDNNISKEKISAYLTLQEEAYYFNMTEDDKTRFIFFLNILQLSLNEDKINIIFDENKVFFDGYRNNYANLLKLIGKKNNFIFCSMFFEDVYKGIQIVCFKGEIGNNFNDYLLPNKLNGLDIRGLEAGYFYFFNNNMKSLSLRAIKVPYENEEIKINWDLFLNNKQKKMHKQLQLDLPIHVMPKQKKLKI